MRKISLLAPLLAVMTSGCDTSVATLTFVGVDPSQPKIGDVVTVTFKLTDYRGQALAGQNVHFRLEQDKPGVKLEPVDSPSLKGSGTASTQLIVTGTVSAVIVVATSGDKEVRSPPISFAGTTASSRGFTFQCGERSGMASGGIHAIGTYDQSRSLIAGIKLNCHAHVVDRNGDGVPGAVVSFLTEAGTIGGSATSVTDVVGNADILYKTSFPLPVETEAGTFQWVTAAEDQTGLYLAPLWMEPYRWTTNPLSTITTGTPTLPDPTAPSFSEPRRKDPLRKRMDGSNYINNPRDNLVTMIAFTAGEEGYYDANNNGKYDADEPIDDLSEPFVDANDNGVFDKGDATTPGEFFVDLNSDGEFNGKNGMWDSNTIIWTAEKILWTGIPDDKEYENPEPTVRGVEPINGGAIVIGCPDVNVSPQVPNGVRLEALIADPWFNQMAQDDPSDGCTLPTNNVITGGSATYGVPLTYPSVGRYPILITDALNRMPMPMTNPPQPGCFGPPTPTLHWTYNINCQFTNSQIDGFKLILALPVTGESFSNLP